MIYNESHSEFVCSKSFHGWSGRIQAAEYLRLETVPNKIFFFISEFKFRFKLA